MRTRSDHFNYVLIVAAAVLTFLFQTIFGSLFYSALLKFLERYLGILESDVIAKFAELFFPLCLSILVILAIYQFISGNLRREFDAERKPRIRLEYADGITVRHNIGSRQTFLRVVNESDKVLIGAQVKVEEAKFKKLGSDTWQPTTIVARTNMSWGALPDGHPDKYSTTQLPPGNEVIDFISGPLLDLGSGGNPPL